MKKKKHILTTGDIAVHCQVSYETVTNWIKGNKLKAHATPGGHNRVHIDDFRNFLKAHDMPAFQEETVSPNTRILVVDDEPEVAQLVVDLLRQQNKYELAADADGFEAGIQVANYKPDLIVLDLMMPHLDGFKVCKLIKDNPRTRHIAILVLTAYARDENVRRALECGADYCMTKPFNSTELVEVVEELLAVHRQSNIAMTA
jgi:excisionase family DNA binding protein